MSAVTSTLSFARALVGALAMGALLVGCPGGGSDAPQPLDITAASPPAGLTGTAYAGYAFAATGGTPPLTWSAQSLPPGLTLTASGQLAGTPATAGTYAMMVMVSDSAPQPQSAHAQVSVKINDSPIVIAPAAPPAGSTNVPYPGFAFSASGGSPPYTWQASGTVPPGLTVGSDGSVGGTPTQAGTFSFSVTASDSAQPPLTSPALATQIVVSTSVVALNPVPAPPAGIVGVPYGPFAFGVTAGTPPLHWSTTSGTLPPGLSLGQDGSLGGTPTKAGSFAFTVSVTDSSAPPASSSQAFNISIANPPPPTINPATLPTATVGSAYSYGFVATAGLAPLVWSETPALGNGLSLGSDGTLSGTPTAAGKFPFAVEVTDALSRKAPVLPLVLRVSLPHPGSFTLFAAPMVKPRSGHTATLLKSGKVLITGGANGQADTSAELFDPVAGVFTATSGEMTEARIGHTATLLADAALPNYGKVLILGSTDTTAELYDPATDKFAATGSMNHARLAPTATLLSNTGANAGKVLVVGGNTESGDTSAELYDPATGKFTTTGSAALLHTGHTATLLTSGPLAGQVLVAGGIGFVTAELYNPATGTFTTTGDMTVARTQHVAVELGAGDGTQDGDVLIIGTDGQTDLYDSTSGTFTAVGAYPNDAPTMLGRTATLRGDGTVLVAGGYYAAPIYRLQYSIFPPNVYCRLLGTLPQSVSSGGLFAPESDGFTHTPSLTTGRDGHTATVLSGGAVLIVGGTHHNIVHHSFRLCSNPPPTEAEAVLSSAELFQ